MKLACLFALLMSGGISNLFSQSLEYGKVYSTSGASVILLKYKTDIPGVPPAKAQSQGVQVLVSVADLTVSAATVYLTVTSMVEGQEVKETLEFTTRIVRSPASPYQWVYFPIPSPDFVPNSIRVVQYTTVSESTIAP